MRTTLLVTASILLATTVAHAEPPGLVAPRDTPSEPTPVVDSYRLETFAVDATAVALIAASGKNSTVTVLGLSTYVLGAPILHGVHGRGGSAVASIGLRVGIPIVTGMVGSALLSSSDHEEGAIAGAVLGGLAGMIAASTIDIAVLSKGDERPRVMPSVAPTSGGMTFGLAGAF